MDYSYIFGMCLCTASLLEPVIHTLPEGEPVVGLTQLAGEIYVLRRKERNPLEVYDVDTYRLQRRLTVPHRRWLVDMTSCEYFQCLYVADAGADCIQRLDLQVQFRI